MSDLTLPEMPRLGAQYRLQFEPAQNRWVILYPEGMIQLNDSAAAILSRCDGSLTVSAIVSELQASYGRSDLRVPVMQLLHEGMRRGWFR